MSETSMTIARLLDEVDAMRQAAQTTRRKRRKAGRLDRVEVSLHRHDDALATLWRAPALGYEWSGLAAELGVYDAIYSPDSCGVRTAATMVVLLLPAIVLLESEAKRFACFAPNGKRPEALLAWLKMYAEACVTFPLAVPRSM